MNKTVVIILAVLGVIIVLGVGTVLWGVGVYNGLVQKDESVKSAWSQVENQYQRRADLVPNLVETVKGFAKQEREVLQGVVEARAKATSVTVSAETFRDPQAFQRFQQAQDGLSSALSRLLAVVENYPVLKSNENFLTLQSQLESTENRIAVERRRFNEVVQTYNTSLRVFPASFIAGMTGFKEAMYFQAQEGAEQVPAVRF